MGRISADTFRRIYLLYLVGQFQQGPYGAVRLQKVTYVSERNLAGLRPFEYVRWHYGQFSRQMEDILDQLESMGYVSAEPLDTALAIEFRPPNEDRTLTLNLGGNRFLLRDRRWLNPCYQVLSSVSGDLPEKLQHAVRDYGYLQAAELLQRCYAFPEFQGHDEGDVIYRSDLPNSIEVDLSDDECDDLEVSLNPRFVNSMTRLTELIEKREIPWDRIREVERLPTPGTQ